MGIIRGTVAVPYGRRGDTGPTETTIGGEWPYDRCPECDGWIDRKTGEHAKVMSLLEVLEQEEVPIRDSLKEKK